MMFVRLNKEGHVLSVEHDGAGVDPAYFIQPKAGSFLGGGGMAGQVSLVRLSKRDADALQKECLERVVG